MTKGRPPVARVLMECAGCGIPIQKRITEVERSTTGRFFCSRECALRHGLKPRTIPDITCEVCGTTVHPRTYTARFCSRECKDFAAATKGTEDRVCAYCGEVFQFRLAMTKWNAGRYCSTSCANKDRNTTPGKTRHTTDGYVVIYQPDHPYAQGTGWIMEHRLVMERVLGRPLTADENVHHINGDRTDNRPENLELWTRSQPVGQRVEDKVEWAVTLLRTYAPHLLYAESDVKGAFTA